MKQTISALLIAVVLLAVLSFIGPVSLAHAAASGPASQDPGPQDPGPQDPGPQDPGPQDLGPEVSRWEYEVVGLTEIHGSTFDYIKDAFDGDKTDLLKLAKRTDEQLVAKTRDLLNEYGDKGWELVEYRENVLVFKRPAR